MFISLSDTIVCGNCGKCAEDLRAGELVINEMCEHCFEELVCAVED